MFARGRACFRSASSTGKDPLRLLLCLGAARPLVAQAGLLIAVKLLPAESIAQLRGKHLNMTNFPVTLLTSTGALDLSIMEPISDLIFHFYSTFSLLCSRHKKTQTDVRLEQSISLEMYILEKIISFNNLGNYHIRLSYQAKFHKNPSNDVYLFHFPVFLE